jgi:hypothetical protein
MAIQMKDFHNKQTDLVCPKSLNGLRLSSTIHQHTKEVT